MITADDILRDLEATAFRWVMAQYSERLALACSRALFECLFLNFRKQYMYIPTTDQDALDTKYQRIWAEFTGNNQKELGIRYHLSEQQIYTIIKRMRGAFVRQRQHDLFPLPETVPTKPLTLVVLSDYLPADLARAGLPEDDANRLAQEITRHLCQTYPGVSVKIAESLWRKRQDGGNDDLFAEAI